MLKFVKNYLDQYDSLNWIVIVGVIIFVISALDLVAVPFMALVKSDNMEFPWTYTALIVLPASLLAADVWLTRIKKMKREQPRDHKYLGLHVLASYIRTAGEATAVLMCVIGAGMFIAGLVDTDFTENAPAIVEGLFAVPALIIEGVAADLYVSELIEAVGKGLFVVLISGGLITLLLSRALSELLRIPIKESELPPAEPGEDGINVSMEDNFI